MSGSTTREKMLDAALDLFSKKGYSATSVDEIAESIGIKGPNLYKYFKGKAALMEELSQLSDSSYDENMKMNKANTISDVTELKTFTLSQIKYTMNNETVGKMRKMVIIEQFRNEIMKQKATLHQYTIIQQQYMSIMKQLIDNGSIIDADPETLALEYTAPLTVMLQLCDREPERKEEAMTLIEKHIDHFIELHRVRK